MSDYKDKREVPILLARHGLPHIVGHPAPTIDGSRLTMGVPLPETYPEAWVATPGAWSYVKFSDKSIGEIVAEVFCSDYGMIGEVYFNAGDLA